MKDNFWFRAIIMIFILFSYFATYKIGVFAEKIGQLEDITFNGGYKTMEVLRG